MILIKVQSSIMEATRRFYKDGPSVTYLRRVKRLHDNSGKARAGNRPMRSNFKSKNAFQTALDKWHSELTCFNLKVNIERVN